METNTEQREADIARALIDDFDAGFTLLVRAYQPGIFSGARRLTGRTEDAKDVAQDTFVRAYRALSGYDEDRITSMRLAPWLWTIALNLCRTRSRRAKPEVALVDTDAPTGPPTALDDAAWDRRLSGLNRHQRNAVVMRHVLDMPIPDIARATDRPEGTVKADISRGLDRLRSTIRAEELHER